MHLDNECNRWQHLDIQMAGAHLLDLIIGDLMYPDNEHTTGS